MKPVHPGRYAAIDIGTVTCRMLVADVEVGAHGEPVLHELDKEYAVTNLGEGVDATSLLKPEAMERVSAALTSFIAIRDALASPEMPLQKTVVIATSASRDAKNADEFRALLAESGLSVSVISGEREAALSFMGASSGFSGGSPIMVVDVGGGSTEISIGQPGVPPWASHSFDIGCRRITERFLGSYPPAPDGVDRARQYVHATMAQWFVGLDSMLDEGGIPILAGDLTMIAVAGTATSAVSMREAMEPYDPERVHGAFVSDDDVQAIVDELSVMTLDEIEHIRGLDPRRAPVILAGMIILQEVMRVAGVSGFRASEMDILQGALLSACR